MSLQQDQFSDNARANMVDRGFDVTKGTHGTRFVEGMTTVEPGDAIGKNNYADLSRGNRTYYTASEQREEPLAKSGDATIPEKNGWDWATNSKQMDTHAVTGGTVEGRKVVHEVEPVGHIDEDPVLNPAGKYGTELTADSLRIKDTQWIPPPGGSWGSDQNQVVQGTLPNYNWNKQAPSDGDVESPYDQNHVSTNPLVERDTRINREVINEKQAKTKYQESQSHHNQILGQGQFPGTEHFGSFSDAL